MAVGLSAIWSRCTTMDEYATRQELWASMKSMLPELAVAITGRPKYIASARPSPKPSERCIET